MGKAGLLEVADIVVVHEADLPGADRAESEVRALLNLSGRRPIPVMCGQFEQGARIGRTLDGRTRLPGPAASRFSRDEGEEVEGPAAHGRQHISMAATIPQRAWKRCADWGGAGWENG